MGEKRKRRAKGCLGCLGIIVPIALIAVTILYLEEDWRGAHELKEAKDRWQAAGCSVNTADYLPPPVPDDQNLGALPIFKMEPDPAYPDVLRNKELSDAASSEKHGGTLNDYKNIDDLAAKVAQAYARMFPGKTPPSSALAQLEQIYPVIVDLRIAAQTRPVYRVNMDYTSKPIWSRSITPLTSSLSVAKLLSYHSLLALRENQTRVAMDDFKLTYELTHGEGQEPSFVAGLLNLGIISLTRETIDEGLSRHAWSDAQLAALEDELKQIDFLALYQFDLSGEVITYTLSRYEACKNGPAAIALINNWAPSRTGDSAGVRATMLWCFFASGWWDANAAKTMNLMRREIQCVDPKLHRVDPKLNQQIEGEVESSRVLPWGLAPWKVLYGSSVGIYLDAVKKYAQGQARLDEDRIVCALERYRLANGSYPASLDALAPPCIDAVPHDVINGDSYHYRVNPDGTFLLYSVGWNQTDDGGKIGHNKYVPADLDYDEGDWVWPMPRK